MSKISPLIKTKKEKSITSKSLSMKNNRKPVTTKLRPIISKTKLKHGDKKRDTQPLSPSSKTKQIKKKNKDTNKIKELKVKTITKKEKISETKIIPKSVYEKAISKQVKRLTTRSELNAIANLCLKLMRYTPKSNNDSMEKRTKLYQSPLIKGYQIVEATTTTEPGKITEAIKRDITTLKIHITETVPKQIPEDVTKVQNLEQTMTEELPKIIWQLKDEEKQLKVFDPFGERTSLYYHRLEDYGNLKELDTSSGGLAIRYNPYLDCRPIYQQYDQQNLDSIIEIIPGLINDEMEETYITPISIVDLRKRSPPSLEPVSSYIQPTFKWIVAPTMVDTTNSINVIYDDDIGKKEGTQMSAFGERDSLFYRSPYSYPIYDHYDDIKISFNPYIRGTSFYKYYNLGELDTMIEIIPGTSNNHYDDDIDGVVGGVCVAGRKINYFQQSLTKFQNTTTTPKVFQPMMVPRKPPPLPPPQQQQKQQYQSLGKIIFKDIEKKFTSPMKQSPPFKSPSPLSTMMKNKTETSTNEVMTVEIIIEPLESKQLSSTSTTKDTLKSK
nr:uncharacterized protein LOC124494417 [Dermatophagoides farinae]